MCHTRFGIGVEIDLNVVHEGPQRIGIDRVAVDETVVEAVEGDGAVHRATVDINVAYVPGKSFRHRTFPTRREAVDGDDYPRFRFIHKRLFFEFEKIGREVDHERGRSRVLLCEGDTYAEHADFDSATYAESGEKVTVSGAHVGAGFVVVPHSYVNAVGGQELHAENEVAEKVVHESAFFNDFIAPGVRAAFDGGIGKFPPCEVTSGDRHPYGRMFEALRIAYLQIEGMRSKVSL